MKTKQAITMRDIKINERFSVNGNEYRKTGDQQALMLTGSHKSHVVGVPDSWSVIRSIGDFGPEMAGEWADDVEEAAKRLAGMIDHTWDDPRAELSMVRHLMKIHAKLVDLCEEVEL